MSRDDDFAGKQLIFRYIPPHFGEERKDRLHKNYMRRKANGKYREYEERTKAAKKAEMDAKRAAIRAEDKENGVFAFAEI